MQRPASLISKKSFPLSALPVRADPECVMRALLSLIVVWMVRIAKYLDPKGWLTVTKEELIQEAVDAQQAALTAAKVAGVVTTREQEREQAAVDAKELVAKAEQALVQAIENRHIAQAYAIEQLSEANAALIEFVNAVQPPEPTVEPATNGQAA